MQGFVYPTEEEVVEINKLMVEQTRATKAEKHEVIIRPAIQKSIDAAHEDQGDVYSKAAVLLMQLTSMSVHPFGSANRRTAYAVTIAFLKANGEKPDVEHDERILKGIREGLYEKGEIEGWLKGNATRRFSR